MKKNGFAPLLIILVIAVLGVISYFAYKNYSTKLQVLIVPSPSSSNTTNSTSGWKTYTNTQYQISIKYPTDFISSISSTDFIPPYSLSTLIIDFRKEGFKDTTAQYSEVANFAVSKSSDLTGCFADMTGKQTINGIEYQTVKAGNGATGHTIESTIYRTIKGKNCFEIQTSIQTGTGSGEGLDKLQTAIQLDQQKLQTELDQTLSSFKFAK